MLPKIVGSMHCLHKLLDTAVNTPTVRSWDVYIKDSSGNTVASSTSSIDNVEIIEYNIPPNSNPPALRYYSIYVDAYRLMSPGFYLNFGASWQLT